MIRQENRLVNLTCYKVKVDGEERRSMIRLNWHSKLRYAWADLFNALVDAYWEEPMKPHQGLIEKHNITFRHEVDYSDDWGFDCYKNCFNLIDGHEKVSSRKDWAVFDLLDKMLPTIKENSDGRQWCDHVIPLAVEVKLSRRPVRYMNEKFCMTFGEVADWKTSLDEDKQHFIWLRPEHNEEY